MLLLSWIQKCLSIVQFRWKVTVYVLYVLSSIEFDISLHHLEISETPWINSLKSVNQFTATYAKIWTKSTFCFPPESKFSTYREKFIRDSVIAPKGSIWLSRDTEFLVTPLLMSRSAYLARAGLKSQSAAGQVDTDRIWKIPTATLNPVVLQLLLLCRQIQINRTECRTDDFSLYRNTVVTLFALSSVSIRPAYNELSLSLFPLQYRREQWVVFINKSD